ncbi:FimV/HubP family polar landmark protein [Psychrobacter sp. I-STPA10]|uniref:FimV/HubP family polar landmark protein n=1 Tax=Psychrobacter sp. I-STPA10 TaxID=2585769 RepID=UPI001E49B9A6|nr:FimV/HubP family polar landmark protein [Psychrobacter sp. I-STPA10]
MNDYLYYILIGLVVLFVIIILLMRKKKQPSLPPAAAPAPIEEQPQPIKEPEAVPSPSVASTDLDQDRIEVAKDYIEQKRYDDASALLNEGLAAEPHNEKYMLQLLDIYAQTAQHEAFNSMYQNIQTQADMITLQQAKEIKQQYAERFPQAIANDAVAETINTSNTIEDDLSFEFENELSFDEELSLDEDLSLDEKQSIDDDLTLSTEAEDELTLSSAAPASLETNENDDLTTLDLEIDEKPASAEEDLFTFDELESQLLAPETEDNVVETELKSESLEAEPTAEFVLDEEFTTETEEATLDESNHDLQLDDDSELLLDLDDENLFELDEADTAANVEAPTHNEPTFELDLSDEISESPQTDTAPVTPSESISEDTTDFFDDMGLEDTTADKPTTANEIDNLEATISEADDDFVFELDDDATQDHATQTEELVLDDLELDDLDANEIDFGLAEPEQSNAEIQDQDKDDEEVVLTWDEPLEETSIVAQPALEDNISTTEVEDIQLTDETSETSKESLVTDSTVADTPKEQVQEKQVFESDSVSTAKAPTDTPVTPKEEAVSAPVINEPSIEEIEEDEDLIFNEGVADTISQLDALDFDFDAEFDDEFEQPTPSPESLTVKPSSTESVESLDLADSPTPTSVQTPVVSPEKPSEVDVLTTETKATPAPVTKIDKEFIQAFDFVEQLDKSQITLDLAEQYLDLGEYDSAKRLVNEVLTSTASEQHKAHAKTLLERIH